MVITPPFEFAPRDDFPNDDFPNCDLPNGGRRLKPTASVREPGAADCRSAAIRSLAASVSRNSDGNPRPANCVSARAASAMERMGSDQERDAEASETPAAPSARIPVGPAVRARSDARQGRPPAQDSPAANRGRRQPDPRSRRGFRPVAHAGQSQHGRIARGLRRDLAQPDRFGPAVHGRLLSDADRL